MARSLTYILFIATLISFNYKAFDYFLKISFTKTVCLDDCNCEEENCGTEKSGEQDEKKEIKEYFSFNYYDKLSLSVQLIFTRYHHDILTTSGYRKMVYSPPEFILS